MTRREHPGRPATACGDDTTTGGGPPAAGASSMHRWTRCVRP